MIRSKWFTNWSRNVPGTEVHRLELLLHMQTIYNDSLMELEAPKYSNWIRALGSYGALNRSQVGAVIGRSRQQVAHTIIDNELDFDDTHSVRGILDPRSIGNMIEIVTRLSGSDSIPVHLLIAVQTFTEKSLIQHLTGIPIHTLRGAKKSLETELGIRLSINR